MCDQEPNEQPDVDPKEALLSEGPIANLRVVPDTNPDLPVGGLLGEVPLVGMVEIVSSGSVAGTQVLVNGTPIRMLQRIGIDIDAEHNMALVKLEGYTKDLKIRGAIMQLQEYQEDEKGVKQDITEEPPDADNG